MVNGDVKRDTNHFSYRNSILHHLHFFAFGSLLVNMTLKGWLLCQISENICCFGKSRSLSSLSSSLTVGLSLTLFAPLHFFFPSLFHQLFWECGHVRPCLLYSLSHYIEREMQPIVLFPPATTSMWGQSPVVLLKVAHWHLWLAQSCQWTLSLPPNCVTQNVFLPTPALFQIWCNKAASRLFMLLSPTLTEGSFLLPKCYWCPKHCLDVPLLLFRPFVGPLQWADSISFILRWKTVFTHVKDSLGIFTLLPFYYPFLNDLMNGGLVCHLVGSLLFDNQI